MFLSRVNDKGGIHSCSQVCREETPGEIERKTDGDSGEEEKIENGGETGREVEAGREDTRK